jgi:hypothetical protein
VRPIVWSTLTVRREPIIRVTVFNLRAKGLNSFLNPGVKSSARTKESKECNNRGTCDRFSGVCSCFPGYSSSNGRGRPGTLGDCGYQRVFVNTIEYNETLSVTSSCPVSEGKVCAGHGLCDSFSGRCICDSGFGMKTIPFIFFSPD